MSGCFSISNIIGPQTFQARDYSHYRPAKLAVMGTLAGCAVATTLLFSYYMWENKRRGNLEEERGEAYLSPQVWAEMTDRENKKFRYSYEVKRWMYGKSVHLYASHYLKPTEKSR
jgi:hypothetical protein